MLFDTPKWGHPKLNFFSIFHLDFIGPILALTLQVCENEMSESCSVLKMQQEWEIGSPGFLFFFFFEVFALSLGPGQRLTSAWKRAGTAGRHRLSLELSSLHFLSWLIPDLNLCLQKGFLIQTPEYQMERCKKSVCFQKTSFPFPFWAWQNISSFCCRKNEFTTEAPRIQWERFHRRLRLLSSAVQSIVKVDSVLGSCNEHYSLCLQASRRSNINSCTPHGLETVRFWGLFSFLLWNRATSYLNN